jgi:hypothetical protein
MMSSVETYDDSQWWILAGGPFLVSVSGELCFVFNSVYLFHNFQIKMMIIIFNNVI